MQGFISPLTPPNLRFNDLPVYPLTQQLLRVTAATVAGPAGVAQVAGSSILAPQLYVAFTQQLRTNSLLARDREPCLAADINGLGLEPGFYLGRLSGTWTSLPLYEVISATTVSGPVGSDNGITVREVDGIPSYSPIYILEFDQNDGFRVTQMAPGVARIDIARVVHCRAPGVYDNQEHGYFPGHIWIDECNFQAYVAIITTTIGVWQQITCCDWRQIKCDANGFGEDADDGTLATSCCPDRLLPAELYVTFGGAMAALGTVLVTNPGGAGWGSTLQTACGGGVTVSLTCIEGGFPPAPPVATWKLNVAGTGGPTGGVADVPTLVECSPLRIEFSFTSTGTCAGASTAVVTEDGIGGPGIGVDVACCPDDAVSETLYLEVSGGTLSAPTTVELIYDANQGVWFGAPADLHCGGDKVLTVTLHCQLGSWIMSTFYDAMPIVYCYNDPITVTDCNPFMATGVLTSTCCTATWTITEEI